ncbi:MAG: protein kinase family protein [Phycisphaerales bacterium]|nr:protein kinase family protein [Phycisphaerales bacterium]
MSTPLHNEYFGPYKLIRSLGNAHGASRFVVLCNRTDTNYLLYRSDRLNNHKARRLIFDAFMKMSTLDHPHLLKIDSVSYDDQGRICVITPYTGNHDGLVTLNNLLEQRDGRFGIPEATRAIEHLLDASQHAHDMGIFNGPINAEDILVDRYGCLQVQFYGFTALRAENKSKAVVIAEEVRSIIDLGYTMMTGLTSGTGRIAPSRVVKKIDRNWDTWFEIGLDPVDGFDDLAHAISALPTKSDCEQWLVSDMPKQTRRPQVHIGSMLRRFRTTSTSPSGHPRER